MTPEPLSHQPLPPFAAWAGPRNPRVLLVGEAWGESEAMTRQTVCWGFRPGTLAASGSKSGPTHRRNMQRRSVPIVTAMGGWGDEALGWLPPMWRLPMSWPFVRPGIT